MITCDPTGNDIALDATEPVVSSRCGRTPCLRQTRCTAENETSPSSFASLRLLQCVDPSWGRCLSVRLGTRASSLAVGTLGALPGCTETSPASPCAPNEVVHLVTKASLHASFSRISTLRSPSAQSTTQRCVFSLAASEFSGREVAPAIGPPASSRHSSGCSTAAVSNVGWRNSASALPTWRNLRSRRCCSSACWSTIRGR